MHAGEEDHARPGWTTSRCRQDSPRKSQSKRQRTEINGESTSMVWPTLGPRTAKEQNSNLSKSCRQTVPHVQPGKSKTSVTESGTCDREWYVRGTASCRKMSGDDDDHDDHARR